jgi:hypothetical protein
MIAGAEPRKPVKLQKGRTTWFIPPAMAQNQRRRVCGAGAVEGMNNKIKSISHRSTGFRTPENFIAAIYHCCAKLLPVER